MRAFGNATFTLVAICSLLGSAARAHTLPVSELLLVPGAEFLHLQLVVNPFELRFFSELDTNNNRRVEPHEWAGHESRIAARVLRFLRIEIDGKRIEPAVASLTPSWDSHHWTLHAQYRIDARQLPLRVQSELPLLTSGSHITQVTFRRGERSEAARLDLQSPWVQFSFTAPAPAPSSLAKDQLSDMQ